MVCNLTYVIDGQIGLSYVISHLYKPSSCMVTEFTRSNAYELFDRVSSAYRLLSIFNRDADVDDVAVDADVFSRLNLAADSNRLFTAFIELYSFDE